ncbi:hypothetical protein QTP70_007970 [Hemibagrus guttatus]|uniref:Dopamine beta-hydroxylase n=1 Tax=Hemibagrus guttatus TaxID=175788 RepID=A0AAE0QI05_9TELE|nr:hypothetical protein QTP70_007970 [Hemibagrus guttatus]
MEGTVHLIYSILDRPIHSLHDLNVSRLQPGIQRVLLLRPDTPSPSLPPDVRMLEVLAPNVVIPEQETTYWCYMYQLPPNIPKTHIVMIITLCNFPSLNCHLIVVEGFEYPNEPRSHVVRGLVLLVGSPKANGF